MPQNHHENDTDGSANAGHHTLGPRANQATPGDHRHIIGTVEAGYNSAPLFDPDDPLFSDDVSADTALTALLELLKQFGLQFSGTITAPAGGDHNTLTHLDSDDHPQYLKPVEVLSGTDINVIDNGDGTITIDNTAGGGGGGGGGDRFRKYKVIDTTPLDDEEQFYGQVDIEPSFVVLSFYANVHCRVRMYSTLDTRDADTARAIGTPVDELPDPNYHGMFFEVVADADTWIMFPYEYKVGQSDSIYEDSSYIYYTVDNLSGEDDTTVSFSFYFIPLEDKQPAPG